MPGKLFPCKNCLIPISQKYRGKKLKLNPSETRLLVFDGRELVAKETVKKMVPGCRYCRGFYHHQVGQQFCDGPERY